MITLPAVSYYESAAGNFFVFFVFVLAGALGAAKFCVSAVDEYWLSISGDFPAGRSDR